MSTQGTDVSIDQLLEQARIEKILLLYATLLDQRDWAGLADVFTDDAVADYRGIGTFEGRPAITGVVQDFLGKCGPTQHMITNVRISVDGKQAVAKCYLQATHAGGRGHEGKTLTVWGEYSDRLQLRPEGWRIVHRELVVQHVAGDIGVALKAA